MFVIIVGGGKTGSHLAADLLKEGHKVKVIEGREDVLERLRSELSPELLVEGDGSSPVVLEKADIAHAQVLAAVTGQIIRSGIFQDRAFTEAFPFTLRLRLIRNPNMALNGRFPTAVGDFKYEINR